MRRPRRRDRGGRRCGQAKRPTKTNATAYGSENQETMSPYCDSVQCSSRCSVGPRTPSTWRSTLVQRGRREEQRTNRPSIAEVPLAHAPPRGLATDPFPEAIQVGRTGSARSCRYYPGRPLSPQIMRPWSGPDRPVEARLMQCAQERRTCRHCRRRCGRVRRLMKGVDRPSPAHSGSARSESDRAHQAIAPSPANRWSATMRPATRCRR